MNSKFSRNCVFSSPVDYFCLVCECRLCDENEANIHIIKPVHTKKLVSTDYFENKEDHVRKIKKLYFCELCNLLLSTAARVRLHVLEPKHLENKFSKVLQRKENFVIAFSNVLIDDKIWNGIIDDTCVICNTEFDEENIHKNETSHVIKLIQTKVEFDANKNVFRKIDENTIHCLTCNMIVALRSMELHFNDTEHKNLLEEKVEYETMKDVLDTALKNDNSKIKVDDIKESAVDSNTIGGEDKNNISDSLLKFQLNKISINFEFQTAVCTKCSKSLDFDFKAIEDHIHEHTKEDEQEDAHKLIKSMSSLEDTSKAIIADKKISLESEEQDIKGNDDAEVAESKVSSPKSTIKEKLGSYAKQNDMIYSSGKKRFLCKKCNIYISRKDLKEHVAGPAHKRKINESNLQVVLDTPERSQSDKEANLIKIHIKSFIRNIVSLEKFNDVVINDKLCIKCLSLVCIVPHVNQFRCLLCKCKIRKHQLKQHVESFEHNEYEPFVVENYLNEFIREIRPGCFHCGYCNLLISSWNDMEVHLQTSSHMRSKTTAESRLRQYLPLIMQHRIKKEAWEQFLVQMTYFSIFSRTIGDWNTRSSGNDSD